MEYIEPFPEKNNRHLIGWIAFGIILLLFAVIIAFVVPRLTSPSTAIENQLNMIQNGQIEDAYAQTTSEYQEASSLEVFTQVAETVPAISDNKSMTIVSTNNIRQDGMTLAIVKTKMISNSDVSYDVQYVMKKEGISWKLWSLDITI